MEDMVQPPSCSSDGLAQEKLGGKVLGYIGDLDAENRKHSSRSRFQAQPCTVLGNHSLAPDSVASTSVLLTQDLQVAIPSHHLLLPTLSLCLSAYLVSTFSAPW